MLTTLLILLASGAVLAAVEIAFRIWYRRKHGRHYFVALKFRWNENHVVPHPFLTFAYRRNGSIDRNQRLPYALAPFKYFSFKDPLKLNSIGHFGVDLPVKRNPAGLRIACLGSSSLANTIADEQRAFCWPEMMGELLEKSPRIRDRYANVEVMNCGIGGWTMLDVFVDFALNVVHSRPDFVVIYQGLNDLPLHLMDDYSFDYAHGRRSLGEMLPAIKRGYWFPKIAWWQSYEFAKEKLVGTGNVRNEVLAMVESQSPDYTRDYRPLVAEETALRHIIRLCKSYGIGVLIASYVFYEHSENARNRKLKEGVDLENELFRRIAEEEHCSFIDTASILPRQPEYFADAVHFSPLGMAFMAEHVTPAVIAEVAPELERPMAS